MDCVFCGPPMSIYGPPRYYVCSTCYPNIRGLSIFMKTLERENDVVGSHQSHYYQPNLSKGLENAIKKMKEIKEMDELLNEKVGFLDTLVVPFRDGIHTDIQLKPGNGGGPPIPAHRALLAARSIIFRNMLESDECKAPPGQSITLPELNHGELDSLLEFLYSGSLSDEKMEKHAYSLAIASHKYEIPFLPKFCENWMLRSLKPSTALDILEISDSCSNETLQKTAINFILKNSEDVILNSDKFDAFALKNPHLSVRLTRDLLMVIKSRAVTL